MESEAVLIILKHFQDGDWTWVGSDALEYEVLQVPDPDRRRQLLELAGFVNSTVSPDDLDFARAEKLRKMGFKEIDAIHIACAERSSCNILLTTDDRMLKTAKRNAGKIHVRIENPLIWLNEVS